MTILTVGFHTLPCSDPCLKLLLVPALTSTVSQSTQLSKPLFARVLILPVLTSEMPKDQEKHNVSQANDGFSPQFLFPTLF